MTPINIMLDLETWGTEPGCDIRSIGACVFSPTLLHDGSLGTIKPFYMATDNPSGRKYGPSDTKHHDGCGYYRRYPLTRDAKTVQWWNDQSDEAQAAFADPVELKLALLKFTDWIDIKTSFDSVTKPEHRQHVRIWAHGPQFDCSILAAVYKAVKLPVPWHYRAPRDTRTILEAAGIDPVNGFDMFTVPDQIEHHALHDALCQARAVMAAFRALRVPQ